MNNKKIITPWKNFQEMQSKKSKKTFHFWVQKKVWKIHKFYEFKKLERNKPSQFFISQKFSLKKKRKGFSFFLFPFKLICFWKNKSIWFTCLRIDTLFNWNSYLHEHLFVLVGYPKSIKLTKFLWVQIAFFICQYTFCYAKRQRNWICKPAWHTAKYSKFK